MPSHCFPMIIFPRRSLLDVELSLFEPIADSVVASTAAVVWWQAVGSVGSFFTAVGSGNNGQRITASVLYLDIKGFLRKRGGRGICFEECLNWRFEG